MTPIPVCNCHDCGISLMPDTPIGSRDWQRYMVHDHIWEESGMGPDDGYLCIACLEGRLKRRLRPFDLQPLRINDPARDDDTEYLAVLKAQSWRLYGRDTTDVGTTVAATTGYRAAATALWGGAGAYVHDSYTRMLPMFPGLPPELPIVIGLTAYGKCLGLTRTSLGREPRITIASGEFKERRRVDDVLCHEMLHAWLHLNCKKVEHDTADWYSAVMKLSPQVLGHPIDIKRGAHRKSVRVRKDDGSSVVRKVPNPEAIPHSQIARWPYSFRRADYDWGKPISCPTY